MAENLTEPTQEKEPWEDRFLSLVAATGNITKAAKGARVDRATAYKHKRLRPGFAARWAEAEEMGVKALEDEARRRAFAGSDTLVIFLLKAHDPEKYRERFDVNQRTRSEGVQRIELVEVPWRGRDEHDTDSGSAET